MQIFGRIALYVFGGVLVLGGLLFMIEGVVTTDGDSFVKGAIAAALGAAVIFAGRRSAKPPATIDPTAGPSAQPVFASGASVLLQIILAVIGLPLVALGIAQLADRPTGPMAELAYILGGGSLFLGGAALFGAWSLFRRGRAAPR